MSSDKWFYEGKLDMLRLRLVKLKQLRLEARDLCLDEKKLEAEMENLYTEIHIVEKELRDA